jgi:hypothetical protein
VLIALQLIVTVYHCGFVASNDSDSATTMIGDITADSWLHRHCTITVGLSHKLVVIGPPIIAGSWLEMPVIGRFA